MKNIPGTALAAVPGYWEKQKMEFNLNSEERRAATAELAELDRSNIEKAYQIDVYTLREKSKDCTNGGETASIDRFILYTWRMSRAAVLLDVERRELPLAKCLHACLRVIYGREYIHADVLTRSGKWHMAGGNFVFSCDSRYREVTGINYPISVHDRVED